MKSLTLKNLPDELVEQLRARAKAEHRSVTREAIHLLERALAADEHGGDEAEQQADAWRNLGTRWASDEGAEDEVAAIYRDRTAGREVSW